MKSAPGQSANCSDRATRAGNRAVFGHMLATRRHLLIPAAPCGRDELVSLPQRTTSTTRHRSPRRVETELPSAPRFAFAKPLRRSEVRCMGAEIGRSAVTLPTDRSRQTATLPRKAGRTTRRPEHERSGRVFSGIRARRSGYGHFRSPVGPVQITHDWVLRQPPALSLLCLMAQGSVSELGKHILPLTGTRDRTTSHHLLNMARHLLSPATPSLRDPLVWHPERRTRIQDQARKPGTR